MECARVSVIRPELALAQGVGVRFARGVPRTISPLQTMTKVKVGVRIMAVGLAFGRVLGYDIEGLAR